MWEETPLFQSPQIVRRMGHQSYLICLLPRMGHGKGMGQERGSGSWWGCLPVIGRDGDQRFEAALKVDLCRKNRVRLREWLLPHLRLDCFSSPRYPEALYSLAPCRKSSQLARPQPTAPLPTHPSRFRFYVLQSHRSGPRGIDRILEFRCGLRRHQAP